jgi:hypothetical protein
VLDCNVFKDTNYDTSFLIFCNFSIMIVSRQNAISETSETENFNNETDKSSNECFFLYLC